MTRDAKIGLLLGLVFIFVIAFIINGLSLNRSDGNELTRNMAKPQRKPGIGTEGRQIVQRTVTPVRPIAPSVQQPQQQIKQANQQTQNEIRFETQIPQTGVQTSQPAGQIQLLTQQNLPAGQTQPAPQISAELQAIAEQINSIEVQQNTSPASVTPVMPTPAATRSHIYTVEDGDSLATIAKQFYGSEQGNKKANIDLIFKANSKILKSPDSIYVGQKLMIPPLPEPVLNNRTIVQNENFKPVQSIGGRHEKQAAGNIKTKYYMVKEGDSLWKIAAEQLGDGNRYKELAKINKLKDEDYLVVGAKLTLP